jgi:hypothetical protein
MAGLTIEVREGNYNDTTNAFCAGRLLKRIPDDEESDEPRYRWNFVVWNHDTWDDCSYHLEETPPKLHRVLEKAYKSGRFTHKIHRFPRLPRHDRIYAISDIPSVQEIEAEANKWLVDGVIPLRSLVLLTAPPAGYKTWLGLDLGGAMSTGADFLGRKTLKTPVVYLDRENRLPVIRERLSILKFDDRDFLKIWGRWLSEPPPLIGDKRLKIIARRHRPLIIIDSLVRFHSAVHHQGKASNTQYRGPTDILAAVDVAFAIIKDRNKDGTLLTLHCYKHRQVEEFDLTLRPDLQNGRFEVIDDPSTAGSLATIKKIKKTIDKHPGLTQKELMDKAHLPETRGRKILQQNEGIQWSSSAGRGKTLHYYPIKNPTP